MTGLALALTFISAAAGLWAAYLWYKASQITAVPTWAVEPGDVQLSQMGWLAGMIEAAHLSAEKNKAAALWTAGAVALTSMATVIDNWKQLANVISSLF